MYLFVYKCIAYMEICVFLHVHPFSFFLCFRKARICLSEGDSFKVVGFVNI